MKNMNERGRWKVMLHMIALAKQNGIVLAYHFAATDKEEFLKKRSELRNISPDFLAGISIHVINSEGTTFADIQHMDPYFSDAIQLDSVSELVEKVRRLSRLNATDIAAYLVQRYHLNAFLLQKTLYYIYADYLEKYREPPFIADFEAFEHGPVEREVYRKNKYTDELEKSGLFEGKLAVYPKTAELLLTIKTTVEQCKQQYIAAWDDPGKNLTHRKGTPWSRARARQENLKILDEDICAYHHLERLPTLTK